MKTFPNGFESWQETHFEIVSYIHELRNNPPIESNIIEEIQLKKVLEDFTNWQKI